MPRKERAYTWYVEPVGSPTNKVIAPQLVADDAEELRRRCSDGKVRNLWRCSYALIKELRASRADLQLEFNEFRQCGGGKIEPWPPQGRGIVAIRKMKPVVEVPPVF